jgi:hypothetical protein
MNMDSPGYSEEGIKCICKTTIELGFSGIVQEKLPAATDYQRM